MSKVVQTSITEHILLDYPITNEETVAKRYIFYHDLGSGAYANVKRGQCSKTHVSYAIKIISKCRTPQPYLKKFVPREVDALKKLSVFGHPFIAQMREFFETQQRIYLITQLATGGDLLAYINSRKYLSEDCTRRMTAQILCALDHIHDQDIVHRDLKCENLLITSNDNILISDFGFATHQPRNRLLTTFCGSYAYAAPEILGGSSYNGKNTDIWSVGVVLYAMLNGRLPFNDTKPKNILVKIKSSPLVMVRHVSVACETFVRRMLTTNAMERPNVCELLLDRWLEHCMQKTLKFIPDNIHPTCFKLSLRKRSSFGMSVSENSSEELRIFSSNDSASQKVPIGIANEFVKNNRSVNSNNTSSTISERVKRKYRQIKTDLQTWASKKRKAVVPLKHAQRYERRGNKPPNSTDDRNRRYSGSTKTSVKYAVRDHAQQDVNMKIFEIATNNPSSSNSSSPNQRSVSAVPPKNRSAKSGENRSKSCLPETSLGEFKTINVQSGKNDFSSKSRKYSSSSKGNSEIICHPRGQRKHSNKISYRTIAADEGSDRLLSASGKTLAEKYSIDIGTPQNFKIKEKPQSKPARISYSHSSKGLPPLRRSSDNNDLLKRKEKVNQKLNDHKEREKKRRCTTYEKAMMYHNIHNVSQNYFNNRDSQLSEFSKLDGRSSPKRRLSDKSNNKIPAFLPDTTRYLNVHSSSPKKDINTKTRRDSTNSTKFTVNAAKLTKIG